MMLAKISGYTRQCGEAQGYQVLYIRDGTATHMGQEVNTMTSMWVPSLEERARLAAGEPLFVRQLGNNPQPLMMGVGDPAVYDW